MEKGTIMELGKENKEGRRFHSSLSVAGAYIMMYTLIINLGCTILHNLFIFSIISWRLNDLLAWPRNLIFSFLIAVVVIMFRWTTLLVSDTTITWKTKKSGVQVFPIDNVMIHQEQSSKYKKKVYLRVFEQSGISKDYPIHYFSSRKYAEVFQDIDVSKRKNISDETLIKQEFEKFSEQTVKIDWPKEFIKKAEKKRCLLTMGIFLVFFLLFFFVFENSMVWFLRIPLAAMCVGMVIYSIGDGVRVMVNAKLCPVSIEASYQWLHINGQKFNLGSIQSLDITSIQKKSDSIIPVQRYMKIKLVKEKYTYWLGSSASISDKEYRELTTMLEKFFATMPMKLHKKG